MGCGTDAYRSSIGLFVPTLLEILRKRAKKAARRVKERKLQAAMTMLAVVTLLSLLVRGGVEIQPGPGMEEALDRLYDRIDSRLERTENKITNLSSEVRDLSARFNSIEERVSGLEQNCVSADMLADKVKKLEDRIEHCEIYSRRENVIFRGIEEDDHDDYDSCKRTVLKLLKKCVPGKSWSEEDIVRAHRLGKGTQPSSSQSAGQSARKPRPMIARFKLWQEKMLVVADKKARDNFRKASVTVGDDLTKLQRENLRQLRSEGKRGFYRGDRLISKDVPARRGTNNHGEADRRMNGSDSSGSRTGTGNNLHDRGNNSNDRRHHASAKSQSKTYSQVLTEGSTAASASCQGAVGGTTSANTADSLSRFRYTPRRQQETKSTEGSTGTHKRHAINNTTEQLTGQSPGRARASSVSRGPLTEQSNRQPSKRPRPPSSPSDTENVEYGSSSGGVDSVCGEDNVQDMDIDSSQKVDDDTSKDPSEVCVTDKDCDSETFVDTIQ